MQNNEGKVVKELPYTKIALIHNIILDKVLDSVDHMCANYNGPEKVGIASAVIKMLNETTDKALKKCGVELEFVDNTERLNN